MALNYYYQGYNCGEAVIKSFNDKANMNIPTAVGSPLGHGMGSGSVCGAIAAAIVSIGYFHAANNPDGNHDLKKYSREIITQARTTYGSEICSELKKRRISCVELVKFADNYLTETLKQSDD